ncbi:hypothetical protein Agub_g2878, partial [Astrephomene gubernaculifera]
LDDDSLRQRILVRKTKTWTGRVAETWEFLPEYPAQLLLPPLQPEPAVLQQQLPDQQQQQTQARSPQPGESYLAPPLPPREAAMASLPPVSPQYMHYHRQQMRAAAAAARSP